MKLVSLLVDFGHGFFLVFLIIPQRFTNDVAALLKMQRIDYVVLNAGILKYPNVS